MSSESFDESQCLGEVAKTPGRANDPAVINANIQHRPRSTAAELASDRSLVERVIAGERKAKDAFVDRMRCIPRFIELRARSSAMSHEELSDISQDVFALVWKQLGEYRGEAPLEGWVHAFCVRSLSNVFRKHSRRPLETGSELIQESPAPIEEQEHPQLDPLRAALERLDPQQRELVRLHGIEGLTYEEIAERIDCTARAARARYQRGVARLRELMSESATNLHED